MRTVDVEVETVVAVPVEEVAAFAGDLGAPLLEPAMRRATTGTSPA